MASNTKKNLTTSSLNDIVSLFTPATKNCLKRAYKKARKSGSEGALRTDFILYGLVVSDIKLINKVFRKVEKKLLKQTGTKLSIRKSVLRNFSIPVPKRKRELFVRKEERKRSLKLKTGKINFLSSIKTFLEIDLDSRALNITKASKPKMGEGLWRTLGKFFSRIPGSNWLLAIFETLLGLGKRLVKRITKQIFQIMSWFRRNTKTSPIKRTTKKRWSNVKQQLSEKKDTNSFKNVTFTDTALEIFELAYADACHRTHAIITPEHILLALIQHGYKQPRPNRGVLRLLKLQSPIPLNKRLPIEIFLEDFMDAFEPVMKRKKYKQDSRSLTLGYFVGSVKSIGPLLSQFGYNLSDSAAKGMNDPVIGRDVEIVNAFQVLIRRFKNNPCLVGDPGVGKTAIVEGIARKIVEGDVIVSLLGKIIFSLNLSALVSGARYRGDFEARLGGIMDYVLKHSEVMVFIDELHTLVGAGNAEAAVDASQYMKPALSRGAFQVIGATTYQEYTNYIGVDAALERRFQPVKVDQPKRADCFRILFRLAERYENFHSVKYDSYVLWLCVEYAVKFLPERFLPDKAIDLMDEAGSYAGLKKHLPSLKVVKARKHLVFLKNELANLERDGVKTPWTKVEDYHRADIIAQNLVKEDREDPIQFNIVNTDILMEAVSKWTSVPVEKVQEDEFDRYVNIEAELHRRVVGQTRGVSAVARALRRSRLGVSDDTKPIASFFFVGSTGVGKTELAKAVADFFFGGPKFLVRFDMSEYMERHSVARLLGSPPGYAGFKEGGQLTDAIRRQPSSVVLFDEVEKAHPDVFNLFLQIMEDGRLTSADGMLVRFSAAIIMLTANIGARIIVEEFCRSTGAYMEYSADTDFTQPEYKRVVYEGTQEVAQVVGRPCGWVIKPAPADAIRKEYRYNKVHGEILEEHLVWFFRPEFLNRLDEVVVFIPLYKEEVFRVGDLMVKAVVDNVKNSNVGVYVHPVLKHRLFQSGYDVNYGVRPLRRLIGRTIETAVTQALLQGTVVAGDEILLVDCGDEDDCFTFQLIRTDEDREELRELLALDILEFERFL